MTSTLEIGTKRSVLRQRLVEQPHCLLIEPEVFRRLAVSNRKLLRADDAAAAIRGLIDLETGVRYVVENERLTQPAL